MPGGNDENKAAATPGKTEQADTQPDNSQTESTPIVGKFYDSCRLPILANSIAVALAEGMTIEDQNVWGNLFAMLGASMLSVAAINANNQSLAEKIAAAKEKNKADESATKTADSSAEEVTVR